MKKYRVIKAYVDKHTGEMHAEGETVMLSEERAKELEAYTEAAKDPVKKKTK